jgi:ribosome-binding protein aMBF1 (putative translation factor)
MITGTQIRSARAALRWSIQDLAKAAGVGTQTIKRFELVDGIPQSRTHTLLGVKGALEAAGIEFTGTPDNGPGVRLHSKS